MNSPYMPFFVALCLLAVGGIGCIGPVQSELIASVLFQIALVMCHWVGVRAQSGNVCWGIPYSDYFDARWDAHLN